MSGANGLSENGWNEWSRHVLKELERLNDNYEKIQSDVSDLKGRLQSYSQEDAVGAKIRLIAIEKSIEDKEDRLRLLENSTNKFSGKWTIISSVGAAVLAVVVSFLFNMLAPKAETYNENKIETVIQREYPGYFLNPIVEFVTQVEGFTETP